MLYLDRLERVMAEGPLPNPLTVVEAHGVECTQLRFVRLAQIGQTDASPLEGSWAQKLMAEGVCTPTDLERNEPIRTPHGLWIPPSQSEYFLARLTNSAPGEIPITELCDTGENPNEFNHGTYNLGGAQTTVVAWRGIRQVTDDGFFRNRYGGRLQEVVHGAPPISEVLAGLGGVTLTALASVPQDNVAAVANFLQESSRSSIGFSTGETRLD